MHKPIIFLFLFFPLCVFSQAPFTAIGTPYTQNFNSLPNATDGADLATWTNNGTLTGWYIDENATGGASCNTTSCNDRPTIEASYTTMNNSGNAYIYALGTDRSIGSRPAGSTATVFYGVRLVNNTGSTISAIYVDYYGEQWTIAENGSNINTAAFSYQVGATVTSLSTGSWTNVPALDFTQIWTSSQSAGLGGSACGGTSNQCLALNGNLPANRRHIQGCINVTIPAGQEIMLRWADVDNGANDHHMQIDDVTIYPYSVSCAVVLPVEWLSFSAEKQNAVALLEWETASEQNNNYFAVQRMDENGGFVTIGTVSGSGTTSQPHAYSFTDESPRQGINYYRLRQVDFNGQEDYSAIRAVEFSGAGSFSAFTHFDGALHFQQDGNAGLTIITILGEDGRTVSSTTTGEPAGILETPCASGIYFIRFENGKGVLFVKQLIIL